MQRSRTDPAAWTYTSAAGVVASAHHLATEAGVRMLERGGNAFDAAVATSMALGVCEPAGSGLGGMALALVLHAGDPTPYTVEGSCLAPRAATPERVRAGRRYRGHRAVAVPMHAAVMHHLLSRYGSMTVREVLEPAIALAHEGFSVSATQYEVTRHYLKTVARRSAGRIFLGEGKQPLEVGTLFRQPALASTLERLAKAGLEDFYRGKTAKRIARDMREHDGFLDEVDLASAPEPREQRPLSARFGDSEVFTLGPPGGGLALLEMLALAEELGVGTLDERDPGSVLALAAIVRQARQDRKKYRLKTGATKPKRGLELLSRRHVSATASRLAAALSPGETSHLCVVDRVGNAVSMTQSIERSFGAAEASPELGFLYNGFLRAFKVHNERHPHFLRPGAVARSNAAPTLVLRDGRLETAVGATGSERGVSVIFGTLLRLRSQTPFEAVHGPRLHCTPHGDVLLEAERFPSTARQLLTDWGYALVDVGPYAFKMGGLQLIARVENGYCGVADPRRDGMAAGPR